MSSDNLAIEIIEVKGMTLCVPQHSTAYYLPLQIDSDLLDTIGILSVFLFYTR